MTYQMTVTLTDQEYQILTEEAEKNGKEPETLIHDMIEKLNPSSTKKYAMSW